MTRVRREQQVNMIDFVIAGTFKGASSTLAYELGRHRQVSIPRPKDPYYYLASAGDSFTGPERFMQAHRAGVVHNPEAFAALFPDDGGKSLRGDATPLYMYCHEQVIPAIQADNPHAKIVLILRNPADRAFSNYNHNVKDGYEERSFAACIDSWEETERFPLHPFFHYIRAGFYDAQVAAWQAAFADVKVVTYEQIGTDVHLVLNEIASFLGIDTNFDPREEAIRLNKSGKPRSAFLHRFILLENPLKRMLRPIYRAVLRNPDARKQLAERVKNLNIESQRMAASDRAHLNALYAPDIAQVSERVGIDLLGCWAP